MKALSKRLLACLALAGVPAGLAAPDGAVRDLRGHFTQGGIFFGRIDAGAQLYWGKRRIATTPEGEFAVGLDRDAPAAVTLKVVAPGGGAATEQTIAIARRKYAIQKVTGIPERIMDPRPEDLRRIEDDNRQVAAARATLSAQRFFLGDFRWPLTGPITGVFGSQRVYNGQPKRPHYGVDVAAPVGTRVSAPAGGTVTLAHGDMFFSGGTLIIDHGYGLSSTFIHLSRILVEPGDSVEQGQQVAEVGATGRATGPHLDWRMNWYDQRVDPQLLVGAMPVAAAPAPVYSKHESTGGNE